MKNKVLLAIAIMTLCSANAAERTEREMREIAAKKLRAIHKVTRGNVESVKKLSDAICYNIYGTDDSFVIISKDSDQTPVLAYSDTPYNEDRIPCGLKWWLSSVEAGFECPESGRMTRANNTVVEQLLTTEWGQDDPFNLKCPALEGAKTPSGCVATAMSQILNYFKYPETGKGRSSYTVQGGFRPWSLTFGTTYRYDLLKDKYDEATIANLTDEEREAISTLLLHCGAAVKMNYNSDGSGAYDYDATDGMATFFRYDSLALHCYKRDHFTNEEWMKMLSDELAANHPVLYCGQDTRFGGHAFIVDGINAEGLVHVNWGWNGDCNGYYMLDGLTPKRTVGYTFGYNFSSGQSMIVGYKLQEYPDEHDEYKSFWATGKTYNLKISGSNFVISDLDGFYNYNWLPFEGTISLVFEEMNNGVQYSVLFDEENMADYKGIRMWGWGIDATDLIPFVYVNNKVPEGKYKVFLGSKDIREKRFQPMRCKGGSGAIYYLVTKNSDGTFNLDATRYQYTTSIIPVEDYPKKSSISKVIYDLNGRSIGSSFDTLGRGFYIIDGKKVVK